MKVPMQAAVIIAPLRAHCCKTTAASRTSGRASAASSGPGILNPIAGTTTQSGGFEPIVCTGTARPCEVVTDFVSSLVHVPTVIIGIATLTVLMLTKKIPEPVMILVAGLAGVLLHNKVA
jgi:hypothetical protein